MIKPDERNNRRIGRHIVGVEIALIWCAAVSECDFVHIVSAQSVLASNPQRLYLTGDR